MIDSHKLKVTERVIDFRNFDFGICDPDVYLQ
jgi:hypothetical protein